VLREQAFLNPEQPQPGNVEPQDNNPEQPNAGDDGDINRDPPQGN